MVVTRGVRKGKGGATGGRALGAGGIVGRTEGVPAAVVS